MSAHAASLGLAGRVTTVLGDSISGTYGMLHKLAPHDFLHIDPYTIFDPNDVGLTYFDVFLEGTRRGIKCMLWYGYLTGQEQHALATRFRKAVLSHAAIDPTQLHGADVWLDLIQPDAVIADPGIVGCGVLTSNLSQGSRDAVNRLAKGLVAVYEDSTVFGTHPGRLHTSSVSFDDSSRLQENRAQPP